MFTVSHKASKKHIATSFSRGAATYDRHAGIQRRALKRLVDRMGDFPCPEGLWADLGCGTGLFARMLPESVADQPVVGLDIAHAALKRIRIADAPLTLPVVGDIEALPLRERKFSRVILASTLQWLPHPERILESIRGLLVPGGQLLFAVFMEDYLRELLTTRASMGYHSPIHHYSEPQVGDLLAGAKFRPVWTERIREKVFYPSAMAVVKSLAGIGATARHGSDRARHDLFEQCREYERRYRTEKGVPATEDILVGIARRG
jgi:malonyl-CoA O-methyltransferase